MEDFTNSFWCNKQQAIIKKFFSYLYKFPSITVIILACLTIIQVHLNLARYKFDNVIKWDVIGYYSYLPATFIEKDVTLSFITPENKIKYNGIKYGYVDDSQGNHIIKYSMGMSVLYAPFFFVAHVLASPLGYPSDGYSAIYEFFIEFSGLFYLLIGLWYLRKLLLQFYDEKVTAITLGLVFFGTNILYYSAVESPMTHTYTFSLFSVLLYFTFDFYKKASFKNTMVLAISFGLILLVRPLNILLILPFLFFNVSSFNDIKLRFAFLIKHYKNALLFIAITFLMVLPQLLYYKYVTGNYFTFSYGKEGFFFNQFHLLDVLVSFRKGWFIYTPLMLLALYGITKMKANHPFKTSVLVLLPIYLYLVSSWWCWWYGGSFSQRSMIDIYPLLALPLAAFIFQISHLSVNKQKVIFTIIILFVLLNIFQTVQYKYNIIDFDGMTAKEYVQVFGTLDDKRIDTTLLDKPDYERAVLGLDK